MPKGIYPRKAETYIKKRRKMMLKDLGIAT
jgi:hypothetical protein